MNNLLSFEEYIKESRRFVDNFIENHKPVNEGLITKWRKFKANTFVNRVLKDEIKFGQEFEEKIKGTMKELEEACKELSVKSKSGSEFTKKVEKIIEQINEISFDTLSLLGDQNIDFSGFCASVAILNVVKWGALLSPIKNTLMIRKAYRYFIGLIKETIRKDLVMLVINFDQFQNMILQKSVESMENAANAHVMIEFEGKLRGEYETIMKDITKSNPKALKNLEKAFQIKDRERQRMRDNFKSNPVMNLFMNSYDNTYKQTAETIKGFINEDSNKQLEAYKSGISKLGQGDDDLSVYGELLISAAEEKAYKTSTQIHKNFLKMSEVFKLSNQKKLIELISQAEKEEHERIEKERKDADDKFNIEQKEKLEKFIKEKFDDIKSDFKKGIDKVDLKDLEKLEKEKVKFEYDGKSKEMSKYDVLIDYLSIPDHKDELKKCSDDIKLIVPAINNDKSYLSYSEILKDSVEKSFVKEGDKYYLDLYALKNANDITNVITKFGLFDFKKDKVETIFNIISQNVTKIESIDKLVNVFEEIYDNNENVRGKSEDDIKKLVKENIKYKQEKELWDAWEKYENNKNKEEKPKEEKPTSKPTKPNPELNLKVEVNQDRWSYWKKIFGKIDEDEDKKKKGED